MEGAGGAAAGVLMPLGLEPELVQAGIGQHVEREERFYMPHLWCLHLYTYEARLELDGRLMHIEPGCAGIIPPGVRQVYRFEGPSRHLYAHFRFTGQVADADRVHVPLLVQLGERVREAEKLFRSAIDAGALRPRRADAALWELLWRLTEAIPAASRPVSAPHPRLEAACQMIERELSGELRVRELARRLGLSHNHLDRLFKAAFKVSPAAYIRDRRMQRARHLLENSTLPIKVVAANVGVPDLQAFNKCVRKAFQASPRALREARDIAP